MSLKIESFQIENLKTERPDNCKHTYITDIDAYITDNFDVDNFDAYITDNFDAYIDAYITDNFDVYITDVDNFGRFWKSPKIRG